MFVPFVYFVDKKPSSLTKGQPPFSVHENHEITRNNDTSYINLNGLSVLNPKILYDFFQPLSCCSCLRLEAPDITTNRLYVC